MNGLRLLCLLLLATPWGPARGAETSLAPPHAHSLSVTVEPARTSIYVGTVSLTMPPFARRGTAFESTYDCKVFPYFFSNEHGTLQIEVSDADLDALQKGQPIDFRGHARNHRDAERTVEGRATPETSTEGRLKVRVRVSRRIELIFNTRYQLGPAHTPAPTAVAPTQAMARPAGFEPTTARLEGGCSIQLSYRREHGSAEPQTAGPESPLS